MRNQESQGPVEAQRVAWGRLSGAGSMKTLSLQRDPDGFFLWHPDYAPWIVGRHSLGANPNDRAFFDPNTGESFLLEPPPTFPETRARSAPSLRRPRVPARRCGTPLRCCCPAPPGIRGRQPRSAPRTRGRPSAPSPDTGGIAPPCETAPRP